MNQPGWVANSRSSVDVLPLAPGANGQPPSPPREPSTIAGARVDRGQGVGHAQSPGVVAMEHHAALRGSFPGVADQIESPALVSLGRGCRRPRCRPLRRYAGRRRSRSPARSGHPVEWARECGGDAQLDRSADFFADRGRRRERRPRWPPSIDRFGLVVLVRCRQAVLELARARGRRPSRCAAVWRPTPSIVSSSSGSSSAITSSVLAIGGTRSPSGHRPDLELRYAERDQLTGDLDLALGRQQLAR